MRIPVILLVLIIVGTLAELQEEYNEAGDGRMLADFYELAEEDRTILHEKRTKKMRTKNNQFGRKYRTLGKG